MYKPDCSFAFLWTDWVRWLCSGQFELRRPCLWASVGDWCEWFSKGVPKPVGHSLHETSSQPKQTTSCSRAVCRCSSGCSQHCSIQCWVHCGEQCWIHLFLTSPSGALVGTQTSHQHCRKHCVKQAHEHHRETARKQTRTLEGLFYCPSISKQCSDDRSHQSPTPWQTACALESNSRPVLACVSSELVWSNSWLVFERISELEKDSIYAFSLAVLLSTKFLLL